MLEEQREPLLAPRQGLCFPVPPPALLGHRWRGALSPTFIVTHPTVFWDQAGSEAQR